MNVSKLSIFFRKWHRFIAMLFIVPMIITIVSGLFLIYRKEISFMQPKYKSGKLSLDDYATPRKLKLAIRERGIDESIISSYRMYPQKGVSTARTKDFYEYVFKGDTLEFIGKFERNDSFFIKLHEGSYFGKWARLFIFGPMALALLFLWL